MKEKEENIEVEDEKVDWDIEVIDDVGKIRKEVGRKEGKNTMKTNFIKDITSNWINLF